MSIFSTLGRLFVPSPDQYHERSELPPLGERIATIRARRASGRAWRPVSVEEALGVPAILAAVTLISNTVGTLTMEGFRDGEVLIDQRDIPRLIVRPNPLSVPRVFWRDTAYYLATRGEAWWWVAKRDPRDGTVLSLYPVPPWEVKVDLTTNRLKPEIRWGKTLMRNEDMRQITYLPGADGRGRGPLQLAGAATSISVEADIWAANFFSGAMPSIIGTTDMNLEEDDYLALDEQWLEKDNNLPRWIDNGITFAEPPYNAQKAQVIESRMHQVGESARMFNMPGDLIEYQMSGSSLRYRNDETIWTDFQRRCLTPHYLEPIEQEMSDLLTRSIHGEFNLDGLLRADAKSRAEVYAQLVPMGVMTTEEARRRERLVAGNPEVRSVPPGMPATIPSSLPNERSAMQDVICPKCGRMNGRASGRFETTCKRCGTMLAAIA